MLQKEKYEPEIKATPPPLPLQTLSTWARLVRTGPNIQGSQSKVGSKVSCRKIAGTQAEQRTKLRVQDHPKKMPTPQAKLRAPGHRGRGIRGVPGEAGQDQ